MKDFDFRRQWGPGPRYLRVQNYQRLDNEFIVMAGPCSVESREQIHQVAKHVAENGATHLRGGVFRAGTYPGDNFGWISDDLIAQYWYAASLNGLRNIVEVLDYRDIPKIEKFAMCFQVGCRQMQNYTLLKEVGQSGKPVFLKRHPGATLDEWLGAAEHVLKAGCKELYLVERGSSTHANHVRWDLSISMIPAVQEITDIPVIVDGSHGTGRRDLVSPMTLAGVAAGADGCLVETHPDPDRSLSDADQAVSFHDFEVLMSKVKKLRGVINAMPSL
jgi:3-deoxy-7-phosphoheptulonate synthase